MLNGYRLRHAVCQEHTEQHDYNNPATAFKLIQKYRNQAPLTNSKLIDYTLSKRDNSLYRLAIMTLNVTFYILTHSLIPINNTSRRKGASERTSMS